MPNIRKHKQLLFPILIFIFLLTATIVVILYGKGYRFGQTQNGRPAISKTGLLVVNSEPNGAQVYVNGNLTTATDNTIDLIPGDYDVKIIKDGFLPWEKKMRIQKEVVTKADALLFPTAPRLENLTSSGVENPVIDPSGRRIAFRISSESARKNGIYVLDMSNLPLLPIQGSAKQITDNVTALFSSSTFVWSPNSEELLASISAEAEDSTYYFLLNSSSLNDTPRNVTAVLSTVQDQWELQKTQIDNARFNGLTLPVRQLIKNNFKIIGWSPDDDKILYTASQSATLPIIIKPRHIGIDAMRETRQVTQNDYYVYDISDDVNMKVLSANELECEDTPEGCANSIQWFSDSSHLVLVKDKKINIMETDGTNSTTIYAGPFIDHYVFPWPNGSKIVILTNFNNPEVPANLYTIGLK